MDDGEVIDKAALIAELLHQAIESRSRKPESVWLAHTFEEAEANANLFAKTQLPMTNPERKRNLIRAFDRVKLSRETYRGR